MEAVKIGAKSQNKVHQLHVFELGCRGATAPPDRGGQTAELTLAAIPRPLPEEIARGRGVGPRRLNRKDAAGKLLEELGPHRRGVGGPGLEQGEEAGASVGGRALVGRPSAQPDPRRGPRGPVRVLRGEVLRSVPVATERATNCRPGGGV